MIEATEHTLSTSTAHGELTVHSWPNQDARWLAVIVHGYGEHMGRYQHVADYLVQAGAEVLGPDHVGHGKSPGERVLISDFEHVVDDLHRVVEYAGQAHNKLPIVVIGHSMGGMIATRYAQKHPEAISALVLSGPVLGIWHVLDLLEHDEIPVTPIDPDSLSRDPEIGRAYVDDPLVWHGAFKRTTLQALDQCLETISRGPTMRMPTLWLHGEDDELVPEADTRTGIDQIRGGHFHENIYPDARHEIFNEINRHEVLADLVTFVHRTLANEQPKS